MLKEIKIKQFRKIEEFKFQFEKPHLLITGKNAQGKTSIAEALYFCAFLFSPKTKNKEELITFNQDYSLISLTANNQIKCFITKKEVKLAIDELEVHRAQEIIGKLKVLYLDPQSIKLVEDSSSIRRQFINLHISQTDDYYYEMIAKYNVLLKQKRKILKGTSPDLSYLNVLDQSLLALNQEIIRKRRIYLDELIHSVQKVVNWLTAGSEVISYEYTESQFKAELLNREVLYKTVKWGNHLDKIEFQINDLDVRTYGSQGQKRTLSIALSIAQMELLKKYKNEYPIVIFDDIFSDLDLGRQKKLYQLINEKSQLIIITPQITNINPQILKHKNMAQITIDNGKIS